LESTVEDAAPTRAGRTSTFQEGYLVDLGLKSRSQTLGGGVESLRRVRRLSSAVLLVSCAHDGHSRRDRRVGAVVSNAAGVGGITASVCVASVAAAGTCCGGGLLAIPNTIATTAEKMPTIPIPIARRARRCVCSCRASLCHRSISLRISVSRSDAVMISFGGRNPQHRRVRCTDRGLR
jgi:hypothetical protein